jgi:hypothetical protein
MSDRNLIDHIRRQTEKRYEHLQEASWEELVEFSLTELEAFQPFKDYRDIIKKTVMRITVQSVKEGEIDLFDDFNQTPEDYDMIMAAYTQVLLEGHQLSSAQQPLRTLGSD